MKIIRSILLSMAIVGTALGQQTVGYLSFQPIAAPSAPLTGVRGYSDTSNRPAWMQTSGFSFTFDASAISGSRVYTLPNATATFAAINVAETFTAAQTFTNSDLLLLGSSTGATTFTSDNAGVSNFTVHVPAANDTIALLATSQALTNKTYNGMTVTANTGTLAIGNAKVFTENSTLTFSGTDGSSVAFGAGGTVSYAAAANPTATISATAGTVTNGSASTFMRSDGAPALPATITGLNSITAASSTDLTINAGAAANNNVNAVPVGTGSFNVWGTSLTNNINTQGHVLGIVNTSTNFGPVLYLQGPTSMDASVALQNGGLIWQIGGASTASNNNFQWKAASGSSSYSTGTIMTLGNTGNITHAGSVTTGAPTSGTAGAWKMGILVTTTSVFDTTRYIQLDVGGTLYKLAVCQ